MQVKYLKNLTVLGRKNWMQLKLAWGDLLSAFSSSVCEENTPPFLPLT